MAARQRGSRVEGRRTTLRVPRELDAAVTDLARTLATTRNEALIRLAELGAEQREHDRARLERSRALVARYEAEHGPIADDLLRRVDERWPA